MKGARSVFLAIALAAGACVDLAALPACSAPKLTAGDVATVASHHAELEDCRARAATLDAGHEANVVAYAACADAVDARFREGGAP